ncbi:MAG: DUF4215 domain-containing protein [Nanoarchaeota archaeon]|nr:DUF4215 domain-containing protein [Nanoarchaeota archaeon]
MQKKRSGVLKSSGQLNKKSQSAIEFFMNYGIYVLIAVVILGTLIYAGVFNKRVISEVIIEEPLEISDFKITEMSIDFTIKITPEAEIAEIKRITIDDVSCTGQRGELYNKIITTKLSLSGCRNINPPLEVSKKVTGEIYVEYTKEKGTTHQVIGEYTGKVETGAQRLCGNKEMDEQEECDDGNLEQGDGCSPECRFTHKECVGETCVNKIGRGIDTCTSTLECLINCNNNNIWEDGIHNLPELIDLGEQCDGEDKPTCQERDYEKGQTICNNCRLDMSECYECGNYGIEGPEECDFRQDGAMIFEQGDGTCASIGLIGESLSCYAPGTEKECTIDSSGCGYCGDNKVTPPEQCDFNEQGASIITSTCEEQLGGAYSGTLTCYTQGTEKECTYDTRACRMISCGNGIVQTTYGEECDFDQQGNIYFAPSSPKTCSGFSDNNENPFTQGTLKCSPTTCKIDSSDCYTCGNFLIEGPEECDQTNLNNKECKDIPGFNKGELLCYPPKFPTECTFYTENCISSCGDGVPDTWEECDDGNLINMDACNSECQVTHNICSNERCTEILGSGTSECFRNEDTIAIFHLDEGKDSNGDTITDSSGNNNNGILYESSSSAIKTKNNCKYNSCYEFDRASGSNTGEIISKTFSNIEEFSLEMWIYLPAAPNLDTGYFDAITISEDKTYPTIRFTLGFQNKEVLLYATYGPYYGPYLTNSILQYKKWHHIALTCKSGYPSANIRYYLDGNLIGGLSLLDNREIDNEKVLPNCLNNADSVIKIGGGKTLFDGYIDNVIIYSRTLNQDEIRSHLGSTFDSCEDFI